jgi:hypothetical protein
MTNFIKEKAIQRATAADIQISNSKEDDLQTGNVDPLRGALFAVSLDLSDVDIIDCKLNLNMYLPQYFTSPVTVANDCPQVAIGADVRYIPLQNGFEKRGQNINHWLLSVDSTGATSSDYEWEISITAPSTSQTDHLLTETIDLKNRTVYDNNSKSLEDSSQIFRKPGILYLVFFHDATPSKNTYGSGVDAFDVKGLNIIKSAELKIWTKYKSSN